MKVHPQLRRYTRDEILAAFPPKQERITQTYVHRSYSAPPNSKAVGILSAVAEATEGNRNSLVYWAANRIVDMVVDREIEHAEASNLFRALHSVGQKVGLSPYEIGQFRVRLGVVHD